MDNKTMSKWQKVKTVGDFLDFIEDPDINHVDFTNSFANNMEQSCWVAAHVTNTPDYKQILKNKPEISAEEDELNVFSFNVYPNPFESNLTVELVGLDAATINVRDISGKLVLQIDVNADKQIVQTVNLSSGLYFIELRSKNELLDVKRIVKQ